MRRSVARANLQCCLEMRNRAVPFAALAEKVAEIVMRRVVVSGNRKSVVPECLAVFPIRRLHKRAPAQRDDDYCRNDGAEWLLDKGIGDFPNLWESMSALCYGSAISPMAGSTAAGYRN